MEAVTGATSSLLPKLGSFLQEEYKLQYKVRRDIQSLQKELLFMNATLLMVAEEPADKINPLLRTWATLIRELSYDMEDVVNTFLAEVHGYGTTRLHLGGLREKAFNMLCMCTTHHRLADMIEEMKSLTKELSELRARYRLDDIQTMGVQPHPQSGESLIAGFLNGSSCSSNSGAGAHRAGAYGVAAEDLMVSHQLIRTDNPVGGKTDMEKLRHWLVRDDKAHFDKTAVLSITGFSGVGKTTIATSLYRDLGNHFDCRAAVIASRNYVEDEVLRNILRQIKPHRILQRQQGSGSIDWTHLETMNRHELVLELGRSLSKKRYILLIDDIRSAYTWHCIRNCLPDNRKGSRVILTTRFQAIGATCSQRDGIDCHHPVDFLCDDESKRLFDRIVSESKSSNYSEKELDQVSEEVCKICRGLPLAIVTMAGLVASNPLTPIKKWKDVCKSLFPESVPSLTLDGIGVTRILEYCYNDLPADLRTCSLYLSIFPKGSKINRKRLTRRLIAEGFVSEKQGLSDEDVAETYFNQLIKRKIIRPVEHSSNGKVKSFQVQDMVLEYILSKSSEENFITVVGGHWLMPTPTKIRRLSVQSSHSMHGNSTKHMNLSQVRSLTMFWNLDQLNFRSLNNRILQVLDLEGCKGLKEKHLKDMCKILVLKYLSLRRTDIYKLPSNIEKLEYLETLDLRETDVGELPKSAGKLKRIINIFGGNKNPRKGLKLPQEINKETMKALRILSGIEIDDQSSGVAGLHQLAGLRKLAIYKLIILKDSDVFKDLFSAIEYLGICGLQTLAVNDEGSDFINSLDSMSTPPRYLSALELSGNLKTLPQWITELSNLNKLTLSVTVLRMYTFKLLCDLPLLFSLTFSLSAAKQDEAIEDILEKNKSESGGEIFVPSGGFKGLKLLRFFAPLVPKLNFPEDAMPALERIEMRFEAFEGLFGIDTLQSLKEVHLRVNTLADEITNFIVDDLKTIKTPKIIVDHVISS